MTADDIINNASKGSSEPEYRIRSPSTTSFINKVAKKYEHGARESLNYEDNDYTASSEEEENVAGSIQKTEKVVSHGHLKKTLEIPEKIENDLQLNLKIRYRYKKDGSIRSNFSDFKVVPSTSILDSEESSNNLFRGFYTVFWIGVMYVMADITIRGIRSNPGGFISAIEDSQVLQSLLFNIFGVLLVDIVLYCLTYFAFAVQALIKLGVFKWNNTGWYLQSIYEIAYIVGITYYLIKNTTRFAWPGKVFLILHSICFLMKMHSYAFYNGYFWSIITELDKSKKLLESINMDSDIKRSSQKDQKPNVAKINDLLNKSLEFCEFELENIEKEKKFPTNINLSDFAMYTMYPTIVYQVKYPRTEKIRIGYVFSKVLATFGIIAIMIIVSQENIYPLAIQAMEMREILPLDGRIWEYPFLLLRLTPPFFLLHFLVFFLIWEYVLNAIAEITYFADRNFYGCWWNGTSWDEFSRDWNKPVHRFLLRHVYHSSMSAYHLNRSQAIFATFFLSSLFHELVMLVIFGKIRFYLFGFQMYQLPLVALARSKYMKDLPEIYGNVTLWAGFAISSALISSLYLVF